MERLKDMPLPEAIVSIFGYRCGDCGQRFVFLKSYVEHYAEHHTARALGEG